MRNTHPSRPAIAASVLIGLICMGSILLAGCVGDEPPMAPERTWEEVRYHRSETLTGDGFRDMKVGGSGEMVLDLQGQRAPTRGLLAGENLETLTRLIDALPPAGYQGSGGDGSFFVSLRIGTERRDYAADPDDPNAPAALLDLAQQFDSWVDETRENRRFVVPFRLLAEGKASSITDETFRMARGKDELLSLLSEFGPKAPAVLPSVDFSRETVIGVFLGVRATDGYAISVDVAYRTYAGQLVLSESRIEPGPTCAVPATPTAPYVLIAVGTPAVGDLLVESVTTQTICGPSAGAPEGP
jgi:hypothetical protein